MALANTNGAEGLGKEDQEWRWSSAADAGATTQNAEEDARNREPQIHSPIAAIPLWLAVLMGLNFWWLVDFALLDNLCVVFCGARSGH